MRESPPPDKQFHWWRRSEQSVRFPAINNEQEAVSFFLHEEDAEHASRSKGEGGEPSLHRLTDKTSMQSRTAQQSRIVAAYRFSSDFLNHSGYLLW